MKNRAVFLDRDGIINRMAMYEYGWDSPQKKEDIKIVDGIEKIISWANEHRVLVVEVSNQPGVAKGKMSQKTSDDIEKTIHEFLKQKGAIIDKTYICMHHPDAIVKRYKENCDCHKPKPGLLLTAARENNIDLEDSIFLGDKSSDVEAGKNAGCKTIIYLHDEDEKNKVKEAKNAKADFKVDNLNNVLNIIKNFLI